MTKRTSTSYLCTLDVNSSFDMQQLELIRHTVKVSNHRMANKKRVVIRGRKPAVKAQIVDRWTGKTRVLSYDWAGNIVGGIANATKIDVYIYDRRD